MEKSLKKRNKVIKGRKDCARCLQNKSVDEFHPKGYLCKPCHRDYCKERHQKERFKKYGITRDDFDEMFVKQNRKCAICFCSDPGKAGWRIDHNHSFKFVRGILCHSCNILLGHAKEDENILTRAIAYLDSQYAV